MSTITNAQGQLIDMTTGEVVGQAPGAAAAEGAAPRQGKQDIQTQGADRLGGILNQLSWNFNGMLFAYPDLATETIGKIIGMKPEETFTLGKYFNQGQAAPRNAEERFAAAIAQGVGATLPFTGIIGWAARTRPMVSVAEPSAGVIKGIANDAIKFAQQSPRLAAAIDVAFGAGFEGMRQAVTENVSDDNPNKTLYEQLLPSAAFVGLPLAARFTPGAMALRGAKKAGQAVGADRPYSTLEEEILRGSVDPTTGERTGGLRKGWQLPVVNLFPRYLMNNAEKKLSQVFGPIEKSPEAQEALRQLELALQDKRVAEAGFMFDVSEKTMYNPLLNKKVEYLNQLGPTELESFKARVNENQEKLRALFDSFSPETRQPVIEAFKAAQADRQSFFENLVRAQKDMTDAEIAAVSERLGPQNMDMINNELRGALMSGMEFDYNMRKNTLNRMGLRQATSPDGLPMPTREEGKSLFPAQDMESGATGLVNKYTPERPSMRNPIPEPISLLRQFIQSQQFAREKLERNMVKQLTNQAIDEQIGASGLPKDIEDAVRSSVMALVQGKGGKGTKRRAGVSEIAKTDSQGNVSIPTGIPNKTIVLNPAKIQEDAALIAKANTGVDINLPEALDYLAAASRFRNDALIRYNGAMSRGGTRLTDAQRYLDTGNAVYKDIEKLIMDHVPKIRAEYDGMKNVLSDYNAGFEKMLPLLVSRKGPTGEFLLGNEQVMQRAFGSADNLRQLQITMGDTPQLDILLERGAIDWLRSKGVVNADGIVDPKKIRQVLDKNRNIVEALPPQIQQKFTDEIALADDYVKRLGELDARKVAAKNDELDRLLKKVARPDADPRQTLADAIKDPATMRVLVDELGKDPDRLAALRRAVFEVAQEGTMGGGALQTFIKTNEKSLKVLFKDTGHLEDLKILADLQRRVNAFADVTGQIPAFSSLDETLKKTFGSGIQYLTTQAREVASGRISGTTGTLALLVRLSAALENDIYKRIFTKALEDPNFARNLTHIQTPAQGKKVIAQLQTIGIPSGKILPNAVRAAEEEAAQLAMPQDQMPVAPAQPPVAQPSAREQLRALPPAPPLKFNLRMPSSPPAGAQPQGGAQNIPLMYPSLFPNDPISAMLQQRQQQIQQRQQVNPGQ
jgi:hypothetical protein